MFVAEQLPDEFRDRAAGIRSRRPRRPDAHADAIAAGPRAERAVTSPAIGCRTISFPDDPSAEPVSAEDLATAAAGAICLMAARSVSPSTATRPGFRRCAPRSPIIWWRRAASSPIRAASSSCPASRKASRCWRGCSSRAARSAVVEDPCYHGAALTFEAAGAEIASVAVDQDGLITDDLPRRAASLLYIDAVAPVSDRGDLVGSSAATRSSPGPGSMAATSSRTITIAISATRARPCLRWPRWRRTARSISARSRNRSAPDCASATWSCPTHLADAVRSDQGAAQQRQSLARAGDAGRDSCAAAAMRPISPASAPITRKAATPDRGPAPQFRRRSRRWR